MLFLDTGTKKPKVPSMLLFFDIKKLDKNYKTRKSKQFPDHSHESFYSSCIM